MDITKVENAAAILGRVGGLKRSKRKTLANRANSKLPRKRKSKEKK